MAQVSLSRSGVYDDHACQPRRCGSGHRQVPDTAPPFLLQDCTPFIFEARRDIWLQLLYWRRLGPRALIQGSGLARKPCKQAMPIATVARLRRARATSVGRHRSSSLCNSGYGAAMRRLQKETEALATSQVVRADGGAISRLLAQQRAAYLPCGKMAPTLRCTFCTPLPINTAPSSAIVLARHNDRARHLERLLQPATTQGKSGRMPFLHRECSPGVVRLWNRRGARVRMRDRIKRGRSW